MIRPELTLVFLNDLLDGDIAPEIHSSKLNSVVEKTNGEMDANTVARWALPHDISDLGLINQYICQETDRKKRLFSPYKIKCQGNYKAKNILLI